jgi:hypothetical protein
MMHVEIEGCEHLVDGLRGHADIVVVQVEHCEVEVEYALIGVLLHLGGVDAFRIIIYIYI